MTVGRKIKEARKAKNWTQTQLAAAMFTTHQSVQRWERGDIQPKETTILRACEALDVDPNFLFGYSSEDTDNPIVSMYRTKLKNIRRIAEL